MISLAKTNDDITLDKTSLTFTTSNYSTAQSVTVSASEDADTTDGTDTITLIAKGGIIAPIATKEVSVTEPPSGTIELSPSGTLTITEGGSETLRVSLSTEPNAGVLISLTKTNADISLDKTSLTFTTSNYSTAQSVKVLASEDADRTNDTDTITLTAKGGIIAPAATKQVSVTDTTPPSGTIELSPSGTLTITEGESQELSVSLSTEPNADVLITLRKTNADISLDKTSLTFTTSNYSTAQAVRVLAREDADRTNDYDTIVLIASGGIIAPVATKKVSVTDTTPPKGTIDISPSGDLSIAEGESSGLSVRLSTEPNADVTIALTKTNDDITLSPPFLIFTASNYSIAQEVSVSSAEEDADFTNDTDTITLTAKGGIIAPPATKQVLVLDNDTPPATIVLFPSGTLVIAKGSSRTLDVSLSTLPKADVLITLTKTNADISLDKTSLTFTASNYKAAQTVRVSASEDAGTNDTDTITLTAQGGIVAPIATKQVDVIDSLPLRTQALALPPPDSVDEATLRIQCKQDSPCPVDLDCSAQGDGEVFFGGLPSPIPAWGAVSLTPSDIQGYTGGRSWSGKGRLGCALRSHALIASQVWTRSGEGVLVNNSALIRSVPEGDVYRADIESIPSPDSADESNIRIRCNAVTRDCLETSFVCYSDTGERYDWTLGRIARRATRHLQSEDLSRGIGYRWEGLSLTCELRSQERFTAQVLTRTGGGGALVNNSATGQ